MKHWWHRSMCVRVFSALKNHLLTWQIEFHFTHMSFWGLNFALLLLWMSFCSIQGKNTTTGRVHKPWKDDFSGKWLYPDLAFPSHSKHYKQNNASHNTHTSTYTGCINSSVVELKNAKVLLARKKLFHVGKDHINVKFNKSNHSSLINTLSWSKS